MEIRSLAARALEVSRRPAPAVGLISETNSNLPPPPVPPEWDIFAEEIEPLLRDPSLSWRQVDALWGRLIDEDAEVRRGYEIELQRWRAECQRLEAAAPPANDDQPVAEMRHLSRKASVISASEEMALAEIRQPIPPASSPRSKPVSSVA